MHRTVEYKKIEGFDYEINREGEVRRIHKRGTYKTLKQFLSSKGYFTVNLFKDGVGHWKFIHRLIAECFIPNPDKKPCVDHINRLRIDNHISNLRWVTQAENDLHKTCKRTPTIYKCIEKLMFPYMNIIEFNAMIIMVRTDRQNDSKREKKLRIA